MQKSRNTLGRILAIAVSLTVILTFPLTSMAKNGGASKGTAYQPGYVPGEIVVKFAASTGNVESSPVVAQIYQNYGVLRAEPVFKEIRFKKTTKQKTTDLSRIYKLKIPEGEDVLQLCESLKQEPQVIYAEPNYYFYPTAVPNDSLYYLQTHLPQIKAPEAWDVAKGKKEVILGIIGTGVDWDHPDLAGVIWRNDDEVIDGLDNDHNGYIDDIRGWDFVDGVSDDAADGEDAEEEDNDPMDFDGHETHVAGLAAAMTNNLTGVAGVSWGCTIMPVRAGYHTKDGNGRSAGTALARAVVYAAENGADFINYSWSSWGQTIVEAARFAYESGALVINSAGNNDDLPGADPTFPGALGPLPYVLSVSAVDDRDYKATYSSYGPWVNVSAPGGDLSGGRPGLISTMFDDTYASYQGTSMAAPVVTGLAGLLKSYNPTWTNADIMFRIVETTDDIYDLNPEYIGQLGTGRINAYRALTEEISPLPKIELKSIVVQDSITGNNNKKIDIGETVNLVFTLENIWEDANNVTVRLLVNDPEVQVVNGSVHFSKIIGLRNISVNTVNNESEPFTISIDPNTVPHRIDATLQVDADGYSETFDLGLAIDPRVLVVDDDYPGRNGINVDVEDYYYQALDAIDISFDIWDVKKVGADPRSDQLKPYDLVIWFCEKAIPSLNGANRAAIKRYLSLYNGRLLLFGQDIGWDLNDASGDSNQYLISKGTSRDFYEKYFHARYVADNAFQSRVIGVPGDPIGDGLEFHFEQPGRGPGEQSPSRVDTLNGGVASLVYPDGSPAAIRAEVNSFLEGNYKLIYFPFGGIEAIGDDLMRQELLARSVNWINGLRVSHVPLKDIASPAERSVDVRISLEADTLKLERVDLLYTVNGVYPATVVPMTLQEDSTTYVASIPPIENGVVHYQILIKTNNNFYAPRINYSYKVGADTEAPTIQVLQKLYNSLDKKGPFEVIAHIQDNTRVDTAQVYLHFRTQRSPEDSVKATAQTTSGIFRASFADDFIYGDTLMYYFSARDAAEQPNRAVTEVDTIVIGFEDFEHGLWAWQPDTAGTWGVSAEDPYDGAFSLADSPGGLPAANKETTLTLRKPLDLSTTDYALLTFWSKNMLRVGKDVGYVEMSADSGRTWQTLTKVRNLKPKWKQIVVPLGEFSGPGYDHVYLRFRLTTKAGDISDRFYGWHIDDIVLREDIEVGVHEQEEAVKLPQHFALEQNYPNPFNPTTTIAYQIPRPALVRIDIYNMLGQHIKTLVNRKHAAGRYQVIWDGMDDNGTNVASGMYFYRMQAAGFSSMRKLLLLK